MRRAIKKEEHEEAAGTIMRLLLDAENGLSEATKTRNHRAFMKATEAVSARYEKKRALSRKAKTQSAGRAL
jgi:hypothetical protein